MNIYIYYIYGYLVIFWDGFPVKFHWVLGLTSEKAIDQSMSLQHFQTIKRLASKNVTENVEFPTLERNFVESF